MAQDSYYVTCPFYKKDDTVNVRCEGLTKDSRIVLQFPNKREKKEYMERYCIAGHDYKECKIYKMLMEKYP